MPRRRLPAMTIKDGGVRTSAAWPVERSTPTAVDLAWMRRGHQRTQGEVRRRSVPPEHAGDGWTLEHVGGRTVVAGDEEDADGTSGPGKKTRRG